MHVLELENIGEGSCGRLMTIDKFVPVTTRRVRLPIVSSVAASCIREFNQFTVEP